MFPIRKMIYCTCLVRFPYFLYVYWRVRPNIPASSRSIFPLAVAYQFSAVTFIVIPINPNLFDILHKSPLHPHQKPCHFKDFTTSKAVHCLQHVAGLLPSAHHPFLSWERYVFINGVLTRNWVAEKKHVVYHHFQPVGKNRINCRLRDKLLTSKMDLWTWTPRPPNQRSKQ